LYPPISRRPLLHPFRPDRSAVCRAKAGRAGTIVDRARGVRAIVEAIVSAVTAGDDSSSSDTDQNRELQRRIPSLSMSFRGA
jgi:hypothetical protein